MNAAVQAAAPKKVTIIPCDPQLAERDIRKKHLRVAPYCRVSTDKEEQLSSYEAQIEYYTDKINSNPDWTMVRLYADEGITGTSARKRKDFLKMVRDCQKGKIDLVITKSVSRFCRNTLDGLNYVRRLKQYGVGVYFEKENVNTLYMDNEMILTFMMSQAQAESESLSGNVKWGHRKNFQDGKVYYNYKGFLGYRRGADGRPEIDPEQAAVVRRIFSRYLLGHSVRQIVTDLMADGIKTATGKEIWHDSVIQKMLCNEKYIGDALLQKTYIADLFSKEKRVNNGELPKYYVHDCHPAIIDRETFQKVQEEIARRSSIRKTSSKTLIGYIHYEAPVEEQNFSTLIEFINAMEVREDDEEFKNPVDLMFDALEAEKPNHFAVRQYKKYKLAAGKTAKSILISCGARLAVFDIAELREVTAYDELELDTLGDRKTALFLIMSDTDDSFNFLISMCYTQLFNLLCEKADDVYGGRLPVHVRCLIDEAANIGQIPRLEKLVATIRSREISACLVLQAQSQLKAIYKDNADTIIGNMDTSIFLGGKEPTTLKELAAVLGKETIDTYNTGESRGRETSHSLNYQKLGKELMSQDELAVMDGGKCILQLRGVRPFLSDKYDITKHPNFQYTADADDKNAFDIEAFLSARLKLKPNEVCDVYEVDTKGA